jgi:hypothetical protein
MIKQILVGDFAFEIRNYFPILHASAWRKAPGTLRFMAFSWAIGYGKRAASL